jgi:imidazolonepropionase-like amidohydrolase
VAPGKRADLLLLDADPTEDIAHLRALRMVFLDGVVTVDRR